jgi:hypothetical protein
MSGLRRRQRARAGWKAAPQCVLPDGAARQLWFLTPRRSNIAFANGQDHSGTHASQHADRGDLILGATAQQHSTYSNTIADNILLATMSGVPAAAVTAGADRQGATDGRTTIRGNRLYQTLGQAPLLVSGSSATIAGFDPLTSTAPFDFAATNYSFSFDSMTPTLALFGTTFAPIGWSPPSTLTLRAK